MRALWRLPCVAGLVMAAIMLSQACFAQSRVALVVGVGGYKNVPALPNALNDARAVAASLERLGFDVTVALDPDRLALEGAVRTLGRKVQNAETAVIFYAGHAIEVGGRNWLLPANTELRDVRSLRFEALDLDAVLEQTDGAAKTTLVFLDACRDNPFRKRLAASTRDLPSVGLGQVRAAAGTLIAFSTAPGTVANDGKGPNSPFTTALLRHLPTPGLEIRQMLSRVRKDVREATKGSQVPWENAALEGEFFFAPTPTPQARAEPATKPGPSQAPPDNAEFLFWDSIKASRSPGDYRAYVERFPNGVFAGLARSRIAELSAAPEAARPQAEPASNPPASAQPQARGPLDALGPLVEAQVGNKERAAQIAGRYLQAKPHRVMAAPAGRRGVWWTSEWPNPTLAREMALERCQAFYGRPCYALLVNDRVEVGATALQSARGVSMPRVDYAGPFDPDQIPGANAALKARADIQSYRSRTGPRAAAYHPWGRVFVSVDASSQVAAEKDALDRCNADPQRAQEDGLCFLYAVENRVVLPHRHTQPASK